MTYDEALALPVSGRTVGIVVAGSVPPFGGSWTLAAGSLTLAVAPTTPN